MTLWGGWSLVVRQAAWLWVLLALGVGGLAWYVYRTTIPPVAESRRKILVTLRLAAVGLLVLFALGPKLEWSGVTERPPRITVLVDRSESMSFTDPAGPRPRIVQDVLSSAGIRHLTENAEVRWQSFDRAVQAADPDRMSFTGDATAIGTALLEQRRDVPAPDAVLLVSDGANTAGPDPVRSAAEINLPVYTIGVGDSLPRADIRVAGVSGPTITFAGKPFTARVTLENTGMPSGRVTLRVISGRTNVVRQVITLPPSGRRTDVAVEITPPEEGLKRYTVAVDSVPGESFARNNLGAFTTRVLKSKRKVLFLADAPGPDVAFWMRFFARRGDWDVHSWFAPHPRRRTAALELNSDTLAATDLIIWHDLRPGALTTAQLGVLKSAVEDGAGMIAVTARNGLPLDWERILPVAPQRVRFVENETTVRFGPDAFRHQVFTGDVEFPLWSQKWDALPPLLARNTSITPAENSTTLLVSERVPLALAGTARRGRVVVFAGATYWRWDMVPRGLGETDPAGDSFWKAVVRWAGTRRPLNRVTVQADAPLYRLGEPARLTVRVYNDDYSPLDGADVRVDVDSGSVAVQAVSEGEGRYTAEVTGLDPGEHTVLATADREGTRLGSARREVAVAEVGLEHELIRQQRDVLEGIADAGRAAYVSADMADSLFMSLPLNPVPEQREETIRFGYSLWILAGILLLLTIEWIMRRFLGLL